MPERQNADSVLTERQRRVLDVLRSQPNAGFDLASLSERVGTSPEGAARTASSLVRRGLVVRFVGGVGPQRVHYQDARTVRLHLTRSVMGDRWSLIRYVDNKSEANGFATQREVIEWANNHGWRVWPMPAQIDGSGSGES